MNRFSLLATLLLTICLATAVHAADPTIAITAPNGGETILWESKTQSITFTVSDADDDEILARIFYTQNSGDTNRFIVDLNLTNTTNCSNYSGASSTPFSCTFDWNILEYKIGRGAIATGSSDTNLLRYYPFDYNYTDMSTYDRDSVADSGTQEIGSPSREPNDYARGNASWDFTNSRNEGFAIDTNPSHYDRGTIMLWVNLDDWSSGTNSLAGMYKDQDITVGSIGLSSIDGDLYFQIYDAVGAAKCNGNTSVATLTGWNHIAGVWDDASGLCKLYLNGQLKSSTALTGADFSYADLDFRMGWNGSTTYVRNLLGLLDDVKYYDINLSINEVIADYNGKVPTGSYFIDVNVTDDLPVVGRTWVQDSSDASFKIDYSHIKVNIWDENTHLAFTPSTLTFDGNSYTATSGVWDFNLSSFPTTSKRTTLTMSDTNYGSRSFQWDLNRYSAVDANLLMLPTVLGKDLNFLMKDVNLDVLGNSKIEVIKTKTAADFNYSGIYWANSNGYASFFLAPDSNYLFRITESNDANTVNNHYPVGVKVKKPLNEETLAAITPFYAKLSNITGADYNNYSADVVMNNIFTNTVDYYYLTVNKSDDTSVYDPRNYIFRVEGNPTAQTTIQPYLLEAASGSTVYLTAKDALDDSTIPSVRIIAKKDLNGSETFSEVESRITDGAGIAPFNLKALDTYQFSIYYPSSTFLFSQPITVTETDYTIWIDSSEYFSYGGTGGVVDVNFDLTDDPLIPDGSNNVTFTEIINPNNTTITAATVKIYSKEVEKHSVTYTDISTISTKTQILASSNFSELETIRVEVNVQYSDGNWVRSASRVYLSKQDDLNVLGNLGLIKAEWGDEYITSTLLALLFTFIVCAFFVKQFSWDYHVIGIVSVMIMGFFVYISWVDPLHYALGAAALFGYFILTRSKT